MKLNVGIPPISSTYSRTLVDTGAKLIKTLITYIKLEYKFTRSKKNSRLAAGNNLQTLGRREGEGTVALALVLGVKIVRLARNGYFTILRFYEMDSLAGRDARTRTFIEKLFIIPMNIFVGKQTKLSHFRRKSHERPRKP